MRIKTICSEFCCICALKRNRQIYKEKNSQTLNLGCATVVREMLFRLTIRTYWYRLSNKRGLEAAVDAAVAFLSKAVKPVMIGGPKLRAAKACDAFVELADSSGYAMAMMPSAKGLVAEQHPHFIGTYWGAVGTSYCAEIVESADAYLFAGPIFNDYSSVGYSRF